MTGSLQAPPTALLARLRAVPWYPPAFAAVLVLAFHVTSGVHPLASLRAVVLALGGTIVIQGILTAVFRDRARGALATTMLLAVVAGWAALRLVVTVPEVRWYLLLFVPSVALLALAVLRRRRDPSAPLLDPAAASRLLGYLPVPFLAGVLVVAATSGVLGQDLRDLGVPPDDRAAPSVPSGDSPAPDIWLILLDGHARRDTLTRLFGFDGGPFLDELAARGFVVSPRSRANYPMTELTMPSLLWMKPLDAIAALGPVLSGESRVQPTLRVTVNRNPVFELLWDRGYEIVTSAPPFEDVTLRSADRYLDDGQVNEFELHVMRSTALLDAVALVAPDFLSEQHRQRLLSGFRHVEAEADRDATDPRFLFIHVAGPHMPAVFGADGSPVRTTNAFNFYSDTIIDRGLDAAEFGRQYVAQLRYLDELTLAAVDRIVTRDPDAVVIVFSDHGSRSRTDFREVGASDIDEAFSNLFAARTPGHEGLFPENVTLVNLFPILFDAYFGLDLPTHPDRTYIPEAASNFQLREVPNPDAAP